MADNEVLDEQKLRSDHDWEKQMIEDYRPFIRTGLECHKGWESNLRRFFDTVKAHVRDPDQFHLSQVKEKFGGLRIYYILDGLDDAACDAINKAYDAAEEACWTTCELTGRPGKLISRGGYLCVRCDELIRPDDKIIERSPPKVQAPATPTAP